jgi:hypothetical protein
MPVGKFLQVERKMPICQRVPMTILKNYMAGKSCCPKKLRVWRKSAISSMGLAKMPIATTSSSWKLPRYFRRPVGSVPELRTF